MDQASSNLKETIYFMKVKFYWKHDCCYILLKKNIMNKTTKTQHPAFFPEVYFFYH